MGDVRTGFQYKNKKLWILIAVILIVFALIGGCWIYSGSNEPSHATAPTDKSPSNIVYTYDLRKANSLQCRGDDDDDNSHIIMTKFFNGTKICPGQLTSGEKTGL
jgi:flagellar basal body-associated protein FliL